MRQDRFRMKLDPLDAKLLVPDAHNLLFLGLCRYLQAIGQALAFNKKRVISDGLERVGKAAVNRLPVVVDEGALAVHQSSCPNDPSSKSRPDTLMAQADPQDGNSRMQPADGLLRDASLSGCAGPWRDNHPRRRQALDLGETDPVVSIRPAASS